MYSKLHMLKTSSGNTKRTDLINSLPTNIHLMRLPDIRKVSQISLSNLYSTSYCNYFCSNRIVLWLPAAWFVQVIL